MITRTLVAAACILACQSASQAQGGPPEVLVGSVEAVLFVCGPIDAKTAKVGAGMLARLVQQHKLDLSEVRKLAAYSGAYNAEVNRLLAMPPTRKAEACKNIF
jgi:pheromone shutdown protein TraB